MRRGSDLADVQLLQEEEGRGKWGVGMSVRLAGGVASGGGLQGRWAGRRVPASCQGLYSHRLVKASLGGTLTSAGWIRYRFGKFPSTSVLLVGTGCRIPSGVLSTFSVLPLRVGNLQRVGVPT